MRDSSPLSSQFLSALPLAETKSASTRARWLGIAALVIQAGILGDASGARLFPITVAVLAIIAGVIPWRIKVKPYNALTAAHRKPLLPQVRGLLYIQIALAIVVYHVLSPFKIPIQDHFIQTPISHLVARVLIAVQLGTLFLKNEFLKTATDRPPLWLVGLGVMSLPFALNVRVDASQQRMLLDGILAFVAVAVLYGSAWRTRVIAAPSKSRWLRRGVLLVTLTTSLLVGGGSALALQRYERNIEWFLGDYLGYREKAVRPGFTDGGRLSDISAWKVNDADRVALRAVSTRAPGYLRGTVFDTYHTPDRNHSLTVWTNDKQTQPLVRAQFPRGLPGIGRDKLVFAVEVPTDGRTSTIDVWLEGPPSRSLFSPLETAYLVLDKGAITRDLHGALRTENRHRPSTYTLLAADTLPRQPLDQRLHELTTTIDPHLSPSVVQLAAELFADCRTTRDKIDRVQAWFRDNFEYKLGIDVPDGDDPLTYFLTHRPPAHCEYFATGTAVLLRLAEVPSRYVTGYFTVERNDVGGYWTARHKDAHAWVEAYDDARQQWVIVESTPAGGVPAQRATPLPSQATDAVRYFWSRLQDLVHEFGVGGALLRTWNVIWSIPGLVLLLLGVTAPLLWRNRRLPPWRMRRDDKRLKSLHAVLAQLDRHTQRHGLERQTEETLLQFAARIRHSETDVVWREPLAECYDLYARLRFQPRQDCDAVEQLHAALSRVLSQV